MLTKAERDEARAFCTDARARRITWNEADKISDIAIKALDDLDAQDAEVARLTAENDRLIVIARADEWQARYWAEHDAVADREAILMAERAQSAAMREGIAWAYQLAGLVGQPVEVLDNLSALANGAPAPHEWKPAMCEPYSSFWRERATGAAQLAAYRKALDIGSKCVTIHQGDPSGTTCLDNKRRASDLTLNWSPEYRTKQAAGFYLCERCQRREVLESTDAGKALLDAHAAELEKLGKEVSEERKLKREVLDKYADYCIERNEHVKISDTLRQRAEAAENAVRNQRGDDLCWIQNPENAEVARALPESEFLESCRRFHAQIVSERGEFTGGKTIAQLEVGLAKEKQRAEAAENRATCDGSTERSHAESTKAAIAALWSTNPEIVYESPAQVIAWLKGRAEAAEAKLRAVDDVLIVHHLGPRDDGDYHKALAGLISNNVAAVREQVKAMEATLEAVKAEIVSDANFGRIVELLFYGPLREKEDELRLAHGKIAELEGELAERALGGEGK